MTSGRALLLLLLALAALAPAAAGAQRITIVDRGSGHAAALLDSVTAGAHVVRGGAGPAVFPRDTTITSSLVVLGQPTYLASHVQGDVVVVGGDLFLRPGATISGRAIAIGGTVAETSLGTVGGSVQSLRDETMLVSRDAATGDYALRAHSDYVSDGAPGMLRLAGIRGLRMPAYDRIDGLSLPIGVQLVAHDEQLVVEPTLTYRSRLGVVDPSVDIRVGPEVDGRRLVARVARDTRTNDAWITGDIVNSLKTFAFGTDTRNYFRSDIGEARLFLPVGGERYRVEPFVGGRFERVWSATATGDVYSIFGQDDTDRVSRPNPFVEPGHIASALAGLVLESRPESESPIVTRLLVEAEQGFSTPAGTGTFTQLTANGTLQLPTMGLQMLRFRGHAVGTVGDSTPRARYAYLGGSRSLALAQLLELGGNELVFLDSRYLIPVEAVQLPVVGPPVVSLIHRMGAAGVGRLGALQQELGAGVSFGSPSYGSLDIEFTVGVTGQARHTDFGIGISLPSF